MSVAPTDSPALRARAGRIPASVHAPTAVIDFVHEAVRLWQLPTAVTEQCGEAAGALTTAMLRRTTAAVHVEVWLHLDAVRLRVRDVVSEAPDETQSPPTVVDDNDLVSIDFGSGTAVIRLGPAMTREGADLEPDGTSDARYARARRRLPLPTRFARSGAPTDLTQEFDDITPRRQRRADAGHRDGVPAPRRGRPA